MYRDYKLKGRARSKSFGSRDDVVPCGKKPAQENMPLLIPQSKSYIQRHQSLEDQPAIELVCRRLTVKWEPLFNIVHRYLYCRCVLRLSTPSRVPQNPECTFLVFAECPRHNSEGIAFQDYGDMVNNHDDPYFDRFGGYDAFRFGLALLSKAVLNQLGGSDFLKADDFETCCEAFQYANNAKSEELNDAWLEYEFEINNRLGWLGYELPPDVLRRLEIHRTLKVEAGPSNGDKCAWLSNVDCDDCHLVKEPMEILDGRWDGRPHWTVD
jgi:hypothetical protein